MSANRMWVVYLEISIALGLAVFIVWWTLPRKPPARKGDDNAK